MAQRSQIKPRTYIHHWYASEDRKMEKSEQIRELLDYSVARPTVIQWLNGYSEARKEAQLKAISEVSGIEVDMLYQVKVQ